MTTLDQLLYGIRQEESGGNYSVVNSAGAVGAYQVMKSNIPGWTRAALGHSLTWQQFRASKAVQDAVARYILGGYYKKYGAAGAAAMWFSGKPNPNSNASDGNTTVRAYVQNVLSLSGGGTISGGTGAGSYTVATTTANLSMSDMAARYGMAAEVLRQNKQIRDLVKEAIKNGYDQTLFQAKLKNTKWWRTTSDAERKYFFLRASDPATYKQKHDAYAYSLNQLAVTVGLSNQLGKKPSGLLERAIQYKMREGWSDDRIKAYFGQSVGMHGNEMYGDAGEAYDQIFQLAYNNGLSYSKDWYTQNIRNVVSGKSTVETLSANIRNKAAAKYFSFANQIRAGQNVIDLAQPYISSVANILELPSTDIGLDNKWVNKAMTAKAGAGQQPGTQYPIWQFENDLRNDPLWLKTNNARETMFGVAHQVAKDFGMAY